MPAISPAARFGRAFWLVWTATTVSSLGDGLRTVAFPLLAAAISRDPRAIAVVSMAGFLPWPLFGLLGGAAVDRTDRRLLMVRTDLLRAVLVGGFAVLVAVASVPIALLAVVAFLLGVAETFFDNAASAIVPMLMDESAIEPANSWLLSTQTVMNTLVGAPVAGALFALSKVAPLAVDAASFLAAAALVAGLTGSYRAQSDRTARTAIRTDIADGLRWLWHHRLLRAMAALLAVMNATFAAAEAVLVLYALEVLGLSTFGYAMLLTLIAVGGLIASILATRVRRVLGLRAALGVACLIQALVLCLLGLSSQPAVAIAGSLLFGGASMIWNVVTISLRQRLVPPELLGRVTSSYRVIGLGAMPIGALLGGIAGKAYGLHMPYLMSGLLLALATVIALPFLAEPPDQASRSRL